VSSQYGELQPTDGWDRFVSLGHPSKFSQVSRIGVITAATSLSGGQPNFARCLAVSWAGTLYIHFRRFLPRKRILSAAKFTLRPSLALCYMAALLHGTQAVGVNQVCGVVQGMELRNFRRGRHLYSAGRPSHLASAHILVYKEINSCIKTASESFYSLEHCEHFGKIPLISSWTVAWALNMHFLAHSPTLCCGNLTLRFVVDRFRSSSGSFEARDGIVVEACRWMKWMTDRCYVKQPSSLHGSCQSIKDLQSCFSSLLNVRGTRDSATAAGSRDAVSG